MNNLYAVHQPRPKLASDIAVVFPPIGASAYGYLFGPPFMFPHAVIRTNVFRLVDGTPAVAMANGAHSAAVGLFSTENTLIEGNLVGITDSRIVRYGRSRQVTAFDNRSLAGEALPLIEDTSGNATAFEPRGTLDESVSDALLFSVL